ncbi:NlpC/P60 family protein [Blautia producta]
MEDFRFVTVEKVYALANIESVKVYEEMNETSRVVGQMAKGDVCFLLKEENQWIYIESGVVRGFVKRESLLLGEEAQKAVNKKKEKHVSLTLELQSLQKREVIEQEEQKETEPSSELPSETQAVQTSSSEVQAGEIYKRNDAEESARYTVAITDLTHNGQVAYSLKLDEIRKENQEIEQPETKKTQTEKKTSEAVISDFSNEESVGNETREMERKRVVDIQERLEQEKEALLGELKKSELTFAKAVVKPIENTALSYTRTTVKETVVEKRLVIATGETNIRAGDNEEAQVVGVLPENGMAYILADIEKPWIYIESGDVRGFVSRTQLLLGDAAKEVVEKAGEETLKTARESVKPQENPALYYTLTSIKEGKISSAIRESVVNFARQFIGNPYVWGGTSLTNGADCSGFVQTIFNNYYGYSLPRVAEDQAQYGTKIRVEDAQPGDLIFYAKNGYIYHVVMYAGDGKTIEAQSTNTGIVEGQVDTGNAVWATRFIDDTDDAVITSVNQRAEDSGMAVEPQTASSSQLGELLGNFKLTSYCNCELCCGQWAGGPTASGTEPTQGRTVAMGGIPFGTKLVINGQIYTVEDRGTPYGHIDIYRNSHDECNQFGVQYANVYLLKE